MTYDGPAAGLDRRTFLGWFSALGVGGGVFADSLFARLLEEDEITLEMLPEAEAVAGLSFSEEQRELMLEDLNRNLESFRSIRAAAPPNQVPPALRFDPALPGVQPPGSRAAGAGGPTDAAAPETRGELKHTRPTGVVTPTDLEEAALWPVTRLAELVRTRKVAPSALTRMYLDRLKRYGPALEAVVTLTEERALEQAARADREIAAGRYRGPLHGIPWGAKDLLSVRGYRTTWGARPFEEQVIEEDATVVRRLDDAGAILVAKLTLGALAWGDVWFGGTTRNPWNIEQGSSGSSAGPAAATVAGLVGFSIGSETLGSIVSPSTRTGTTGLRPTFGRVSRHGAMALSWSMDKLGPMCRSVEDCALVMHAIAGPDGLDPTVRDVPFSWDSTLDPRALRVGFYRSAFETERPGADFDDAALAALRGLGIDPVPVELPRSFPVGALRIILNVEAATAFDELTRSGRDALLTRQVRNAWPNVFRQARLVPAVEYVQANRIRTQLMEATDRALDGIDVFIAPSFAGDVLTITNLTGHPTVVVPSGFREDGTPVSISFVGNLWRDAEALALAKAYQDATGFHLRRPPLERLTPG